MKISRLCALLGALAPEVIAILRSTADRSEDGRRTLVHPARALAAAGYQP